MIGFSSAFRRKKEWTERKHPARRKLTASESSAAQCLSPKKAIEMFSCKICIKKNIKNEVQHKMKSNTEYWTKLGLVIENYLYVVLDYNI